MNRVGSQLTFCSPRRILRQTVVERDEHNVITRFFNLDDATVESEHTLFYDGIISAEISSLKQNLTVEKIQKLVTNYSYFDLSEDFSSFEIPDSEKPLLLDFGTTSTEKINPKLFKLARLNPNLSVFDLIASCVFYPALLLGKSELTENTQHDLLLWVNINLVNKNLTTNSKLRKL